MRGRRIFIALTGAAFLMNAAVFALAQTTTVHYKEVHWQFTGDYVPVGDPANGQVYGFWVRRGLTIFETGEVATYSALGNFDATKGVGMISGYDKTVFQDGSSWTTKFQGQFSVGPKGLWVIPHKGEFTGGTGRFAGIKGNLTYTSRQISTDKDFADFAETEGTAVYTLPK